MAFSPTNSPANGIFIEKDYGQYFEFVDGPGDEHGHSIHATHRIYVSEKKDWGGCHMRYAKVLKTVCYVAVDEDENGNTVWEKWVIKNYRKYETQ